MTPVGRIPRGPAGTSATLFQMRRLVAAAQRDPLTVQVASRIVGGALRSTALMAAAIRSWVGVHFRFQADPVDVELLRSVPEMLRNVQAQGVVQADCDDAAVLAAALGKAVGMRARFVVLAFGGGRAPWSHVYAQLLTSTGWQDMDVTRPPTPAPPSRYAMQEV